MSNSFIQILLLGMGLAGSLFITIARNSFQAGIALAFLYFISFIQILAFWPPGQAAIKLITGLIAVVLLVFPNIPSSKLRIQSATPIETTPIWFRLTTGLLAWVLAFALVPSLNVWLTLPSLLLTYSFVLILDGLFLVSLSDQPAMFVVGILLALCGFETMYAALEGSALVTALLSVITLSLALLGGFMQSRYTVEGT